MAKKAIIKAEEADKTNNIDKEKDFYIPRDYSRSKTNPLFASNSSTSSSPSTIKQIETMLKNPYSNYKQLQLVSEYLTSSNSNYNNILDYFAGIMTFDYVLFPISNTDNKVTIKNRLYNSAKIISKMTLENVFPTMLKEALRMGESYWYDLSDNENTIIEKLPKEICCLSQIDDDNLWRIYVDCALINPTKVGELPEEIQTAYQNYIDNKKNKNKGKNKNDGIDIPESYYEVSKKGFAIFAHMDKKLHDYPMFAHMFCDLTLLTADKSYFNEYIKDDAVKVIHQKVPLDKETNKPTMDKDIVEAYHNSSKEHVGKNIAIVTTPFETQGIAIDKNQQSALNVVEHDTKVVENDSGISETIFNANTTNGLGYSTKADASRMYPLLYFFTNFVNYKIKQFKCQIKFLRTNIYERDEIHESHRADLLSGGSRSLFMASSELDLYSYMNLAEMEKLLDFDSMLEPKMNASQMNKDDINLNGRPPKKEGDKADSTIVVDENK